MLRLKPRVELSLFGCNRQLRLLGMSVVIGLALAGAIHAQESPGNASSAPIAGSPSAKNVILITLDGLRPEEVFTGADRRLMIPDLGVKDVSKHEALYWRETPEERRRVLLPFLWQQVESGGWIAGNVFEDSHVTVTNGKFFSYPGYNELLSGIADAGIDSNAKKYNENVTVLEWLNQQSDLTGSVAAYCSWDVFPYIINDRRSGVPVNAGWMPLTVGDPKQLAALNFAAENMFHEWDGVRYDCFTTAGALQAMQTTAPRVLYVALGETDDWAHGGRYDRYLLSAQQNDNFIKQLYEMTQQIEQYRNQTAFIVTSDHGRGDGQEGWKSHGVLLPGSNRTWVAAFGTGIEPQNQATVEAQVAVAEFTQSQIAATVAAVMGYDFAASNDKIAPALPIIMPQQ